MHLLATVPIRQWLAKAAACIVQLPSLLLWRADHDLIRWGFHDENWGFRSHVPNTNRYPEQCRRFLGCRIRILAGSKGDGSRLFGVEISVIL